MNDETYASVLAILDYYMPEEKKHWLEAGKPEGHIYTHLKQLSIWADEVAKEYTN